MTISWTDAAINEAIGAYYEQKRGTPEKDMRAALDAAVKAQPGIITADEFSNSQRRAYRLGRADALEEAARVCEGDFDSEMRAYGKGFAADIRALKDAKP